MALVPRLVSGSSAKRPEPSGINAMLRVQQNSTGQPWARPGHPRNSADPLPASVDTRHKAEHGRREVTPAQDLVAYDQLADGIQHDHRDLALGLLLVIGIGWPELERLLPQPRALRAGGRPGPRLQLGGPDLHVDLRVREQIAVPAGVFWRAAFRGDDDITVAVLAVEQREDEPLPRLAAGRRQQQ